jgi:hypothetical protein
VNATPADTPGERASHGARRIGAAWRALGPEQRLAAVAALGLVVTMFLPWYHRSVTNTGPRGGHGSSNVNAFQAFTFVEGAILLIAAGVLILLFARAERRAFHLPGGDGTTVMAAGLWTTFLLIWRLFDQPSPSVAKGTSVDVGIQWGLFFAFVAAGMLVYAGHRMRAARRPEPPLHPRHPEPPPGEPVEVHIPDDRPHLDETKVMPRREPPTDEAPTRLAAQAGRAGRPAPPARPGLIRPRAVGESPGTGSSAAARAPSGRRRS